MNNNNVNKDEINIQSALVPKISSNRRSKSIFLYFGVVLFVALWILLLPSPLLQLQYSFEALFSKWIVSWWVLSVQILIVLLTVILFFTRGSTNRPESSTPSLLLRFIFGPLSLGALMYIAVRSIPAWYIGGDSGEPSFVGAETFRALLTTFPAVFLIVGLLTLPFAQTKKHLLILLLCTAGIILALPLIARSTQGIADQLNIRQAENANSTIENARSIQDCEKLSLSWWDLCVDKTLASEADYQTCLVQAKTKKSDLAVNVCNNSYGKLRIADATSVSDCSGIITKGDWIDCIQKNLKTSDDYQACLKTADQYQGADVCHRVYGEITKDGAICNLATDQSEAASCWQSILASVTSETNPKDCLKFTLYEKQCFMKLLDFHKADRNRLIADCGTIFTETKLLLDSNETESCSIEILDTFMASYIPALTTVAECGELVDKISAYSYWEKCLKQTLKTEQDYNQCLHIAQQQPSYVAATYQDYCNKVYTGPHI